jgi:hypothetical protein
LQIYGGLPVAALPGRRLASGPRSDAPASTRDGGVERKHSYVVVHPMRRRAS